MFIDKDSILRTSIICLTKPFNSSYQVICFEFKNASFCVPICVILRSKINDITA